MLIDGSELVADFSQAAGDLDLPGWPCELEPELLPAPHHPPRLRPGYGAVYAFVRAPGSCSTLCRFWVRRFPSGRATQFGFVGPAIGRTNRLATGLGRVFWEGIGNRQPEPTGRYRSGGRALGPVRTTNEEMRRR